MKLVNVRSWNAWQRLERRSSGALLSTADRLEWPVSGSRKLAADDVNWVVTGMAASRGWQAMSGQSTVGPKAAQPLCAPNVAVQDADGCSQNRPLIHLIADAA